MRLFRAGKKMSDDSWYNVGPVKLAAVPLRDVGVKGIALGPQISG